jgi:hypothetical protein
MDSGHVPIKNCIAFPVSSIQLSSFVFDVAPILLKKVFDIFIAQ